VRNFFVVPSEVDLPIFPDEGGNYYVTVKERLSYGEQKLLESASLTSLHYNANNVEGESEIGLDFHRHAMLRLMTWITDWNLTDHTGKTLPVSKSAIQNLDPAVAEEIIRVLDEHVLALEKKDKTPTIALVSATTSS
jgi:hypothetical protein